jgi:hypothetical protein
MKRDDDFIRQMLLDLEASDELLLAIYRTHDETAEDRKRYQHAELLCDAGYFVSSKPGIFRMTNQGHDYLAAIRSDTVWNKTKKMAESVGGVTLGIMRDTAIWYLKQEIEKKTGVDF